jgi:hypothetical protein
MQSRRGRNDPCVVQQSFRCLRLREVRTITRCTPARTPDDVDGAHTLRHNPRRTPVWVLRARFESMALRLPSGHQSHSPRRETGLLGRIIRKREAVRQYDRETARASTCEGDDAPLAEGLQLWNEKCRTMRQKPASSAPAGQPGFLTFGLEATEDVSSSRRGAGPHPWAALTRSSPSGPSPASRGPGVDRDVRSPICP